MSIILILEVVAFILFILAAINIPSSVSLGWAGMAVLTLALLVGGPLLR